MPRSLVRNRTEETRKLFFGEGCRKVDMQKLSKKLGINIRTLYNHRQNPYKITLEEAVRIAKAVEMTDEEWLAIRK